MESVLHIEPITRQAPAPLNIGHNEWMFYGEALNNDDDNIGAISSVMTLGSPLMGLDSGAHASHVPMVKTIGYMPDFSRDKGNVYIETVHLLNKDRSLIPVRSKLRSGLGMGIRFSHLPSLNLARKQVTGFNQDVCDPRSEIVSDVLLRDEIFRRRQNGGLRDWLQFELQPSLDKKPYTTVSFDAEDINKMVPRYINQVRDTPTDYSQRDLATIAETICPMIRDENLFVPNSHRSFDPIVTPLSTVRHNLVPNSFDFRSMGSIPVNRLPMIDYNPKAFQNICDLIDFIPLTDFNVDLVISLDSEIIFYEEHLAINRFGYLADVDIGLYRNETILREYLDPGTLNEIVDQFAQFHTGISETVREYVTYNPVKIKIIKTLSDEAAVLLYAFDSSPNDPPLCGVYFDIALQSLAPMSVISVPIGN